MTNNLICNLQTFIHMYLPHNIFQIKRNAIIQFSNFLFCIKTFYFLKFGTNNFKKGSAYLKKL